MASKLALHNSCRQGPPPQGVEKSDDPGSPCLPIGRGPATVMRGWTPRAPRPQSRLWGGLSEIEEIGEDLAHLVQHLRAHVADRFSEPPDGDRAYVLALRR